MHAQILIFGIFSKTKATLVPASKPTNVVAKLIAMKRDDEVPETIFDHTELGADYFVNFELTTAKNSTSI